MSQRNPSQRCHHQLVVVDAEVGLREVRSHLELAGRHLVVTRGDRYGELVKLELRLRDAALDSLRNAAEVVILELLATWWGSADESTPAHHQVWSQPEVSAIDEEVFLLGAQSGENALHSLVADEIEQLDRFLGKDIGAAKKGRHLVERFTVVADENRRDAERAGPGRFDDEDRARRIPRRVAACLPRCAQSAGWKAGCVGLALDQLIAGEGLHWLAVVVKCEKRVMLLGGQASLWLEPVGEVSHASGDRPLLDHLCDDRRDRQIELLSVSDRGGETGENLLRELVAQLADAEGIDAEVLGGRAWYSILVEARRDSRVAGRDFGQQGFTGSNGGSGHGNC